MKTHRTNRIRKYFRPSVTSLEGRSLLSKIGPTPDPGPPAAGGTDVLTYHNDTSRTGANLNETTLTPQDVNASTSSLIHRLKTLLPAGQTKPTVVLVHGAWADASSWSGEVTTLQAAGYDVRAIANPLQDLTTDSEFVADYLKTIPGPVVLVGHSYGGAVITNAAAGLANVKALVYVDASAPAPGETNGQLSGANSILTKDTPAQLFFTTSYPNAPAGASELYLNENIFIHNFANDLPRREAERLWASQRGASTVAFGTPSKTAAWMTIPSWYFISTGDQIITAQSELAMAQRAHSHITLFRGGSHLTLISHPNAVTSVIADAIASLATPQHQRTGGPVTAAAWPESSPTSRR
jgi:pimeloyl-ACP methyl ester carboxylesterase